MQHILVCTEDSVLAKKVRILLARDNCDVEILRKPNQLERRLAESALALLVVSRNLSGEDAIDMVARFNPALEIPPTLILGGQHRITADFIRLIPDPIDTQAIYRIASEILGVEDDFANDEDLTHIAVERPARSRKRTERDAGLRFSEVTGLDEIAGQLEELEADRLSENLSDAFDIDEASGIISAHGSPTASHKQPDEVASVLGGLLEPARFAKALYQAWSSRASGALIVAKDEETLTIFFENGSPVHVESSVAGDMLGRQLVTRAKISEDQYSEAAKRSIERGLTIGSALVELNYFSTEELGLQMGQSAQDHIIACFAERQGAFEFDSKRNIPINDRPYSLDVGMILSHGLKTHADEGVIDGILGDLDDKYFVLRKSIQELTELFPLTAAEIGFLEFSGQAYTVMDASESSGMSLLESKKLMAILTTCDEVDEFTPSIQEFEARIRAERQRTKDLERQFSELPGGQPGAGSSDIPGLMGGSFTAGGQAGIAEVPSGGPSLPPPVPAPVIPTSPPPAPPPLQASMPPPPPSAPPPVPNGEGEIPPMPIPGEGSKGEIPRPLVYAKPLPRGPDGAPLETPERTRSREHFQRGVKLLGQGNFASAEEAFRDAVALCSEEHVYLIGLARAIYYNPGYRPDGKVPVLRAIVGRAEQLAPEDNRVSTLKTWVMHAEATHGATA